MSVRELQAATKQFDEPSVADRSRPLTPEEKSQWRRVKLKRGRPKTGQGYRRISVSIEGGLLKRITALAKRRRISRSKLFAQALQDALQESL
jgi:hypothetical protein